MDNDANTEDFNRGGELNDDGISRVENVYKINEAQVVPIQMSSRERRMIGSRVRLNVMVFDKNEKLKMKMEMEIKMKRNDGCLKNVCVFFDDAG